MKSKKYFLSFLIILVFGYFIWASPTIIFVDPTPSNNNHTSHNWVYINITSGEDLNLSLVEWGNSSGFTNISMSNSSTTNWYVNITDLSDYAYNYTIFAQNASGSWNQSYIRYIAVDAVSPYYIDGCTILNKSNSKHYLTTDIINATTSNYGCLDFEDGYNITLDCQNHIVDGIQADGTAGISIVRFVSETTNNTVNNCYLSDWKDYNIYISLSNGNSFNNITSTSARIVGIMMSGSDYNNFTNVISSYTDIQSGIYVASSDFNRFVNVTANSNPVGGVQLGASAVSNVFINSTFNSNGYHGIYPSYSDSNNFTGCTANYNVQYGAYLSRDSDNNIIRDSTFTGNLLGGLYFDELSGDDPENNLIYNNFFNNSGTYGNIRVDNNIINDNYMNTTKKIDVNIYNSLNPYIGGNYYTNSTGDDFSDICVDSDYDGFCDIIYNHTVGSSVVIDYLPLSDEYIEGWPSPTITIQSPLNQTYNTSIIWFNVTLNEPGSWCGYSLDGTSNKTMTNSSGNWNAQNSSMTKGSHNVIFYCNDTAGNMNKTTSRYFVVNASGPLISINSPTAQSYSTNIINLNISITEPTLGYTWFNINDGFNDTLYRYMYPFFRDSHTESENNWSEEYGNGEVIINHMADTSERWYGNSSIASGFIDKGAHSAPSIFEKDSIWYCITGDAEGRIFGYQLNQTNSKWYENASIVAGLSDIGDDSTPNVFQKNSTWYLIMGEKWGAHYGYNWTGSTWQSDSCIVSGLIDKGGYSTPTVYEKDSKWYLISGEVDGLFYGYQWNETNSSWYENTSIVSGLVDVGSLSSPVVFEKDSEWYMIAGESHTTYNGYQWNETNSSWYENTGIISGIVSSGYSKPSVYLKDSIHYLIHGVIYGGHYGFQWNVPNDEITPVVGDYFIGLNRTGLGTMDLVYHKSYDLNLNASNSEFIEFWWYSTDVSGDDYGDDYILQIFLYTTNSSNYYRESNNIGEDNNNPRTWNLARINISAMTTTGSPSLEDIDRIDFNINPEIGMLTVGSKFVIDNLRFVGVHNHSEFNLNLSLADDTYNISVYSNDTLGNMNSESITFKVDTIMHIISILSPTNQTTLPAGTTQATISITTDENATCRYSPNASFNYLNGTNFTTTGEMNHSFIYSGLSDGNSYNLYYKCNDTAGNINNHSTHHYFAVASASSSSSSSSSGGSSSSSSSGGVVIPPKECTVDNNCSSDKYCLKEKCVQVKCKCGVIAAHKCLEYECCSDDDCGNEEICQDNICTSGIENETANESMTSSDIKAEVLNLIEETQEAMNDVEKLLNDVDETGNMTLIKGKLAEAIILYEKEKYEESKEVLFEARELINNAQLLAEKMQRNRMDFYLLFCSASIAFIFIIIMIIKKKISGKKYNDGLLADFFGLNKQNEE